MTTERKWKKQQQDTKIDNRKCGKITTETMENSDRTWEIAQKTLIITTEYWTCVWSPGKCGKKKRVKLEMSWMSAII